MLLYRCLNPTHMTTQHPITPPPELVQQWASEFYGTTIAPGDASIDIATQAARWGADQELEACCKWLPKLPPWSGNDLRKHRRPKPPSLKEQALDILKYPKDFWSEDEVDTIRRALEQLDD